MDATIPRGGDQIPGPLSGLAPHDRDIRRASQLHAVVDSIPRSPWTATRIGNIAIEKGLFLKTHGISVQDSALSLAISPEMGEFLFNLTLLKRPKAILELGSSRGVSTLYFAEALRVLGKGKVVATEIDESKCDTLWQNVQSMGLASYVDLFRGDVFSTVATMNESFDMVFIDIWASGYLDVFQKVEKLLKPGAIILADNMYTSSDEVLPFKNFLNNNPGISNMTLDFESGVELGIVL